MSSYPLQDAQRPSLRAAPTALSRTHSRSSSQSFATPRKTPTPFFPDLSSATSQTISALGPPAKRQRLDGVWSASDGTGTKNGPPTEQKRDSKAVGNEASSEGQEKTKLALFPPIPKPSGYKSGPSETKSVQPLPREELSTKPYSLDPPKSAPRLAQKARIADFVPWHGGQAEDVLNEQTIRQGYYDKIQVSQNETGSARSIVLGSVKHKHGLKLLSTLYLSTLKRREAAGLVTTKNTFKLPPRVTLTDTKREAWLRDLADASIPLRRLSRSIPHGIRGKILLDQCLTKRILTWRAIWLAKCVGANEIRAFKRKGTTGAFVSGSESKWAKDWTSSVQQFLESLVDNYSCPGQEDSMAYGMQLVSHIYSVRLIDQDFFLDGLIGAVHNAITGNLKGWLSVLDVFTQEIVSRRRRGRKLACALLEQIIKNKKDDAEESKQPLLDQLSELVRSLVLSHSNCFILPERWNVYGKALRSCGNDPVYSSCLEKIEHRSLRVSLGSGSTDYLETLKDRRKLIQLLDNARWAFEYADLLKRCRATTSNAEVLIWTVVEWSTTSFRISPHRLYLGVRLLRSWARQDIDIDKHVINFLHDPAAVQRIDHSKLYKLVAELVRSRHLSISRYIQRLMALGSSMLSENNAHTQFELELLNNIPLYGLPDHILNLRNIILRNTHPQHRSLNSLEQGKAYCASLVPCLRSDGPNAIYTPSKFALQSLDGAAKLELTRWIRQQVAVCLSDDSSDEDVSIDGEDARSASLTLADFDSLCSILTQLEDFAILADIHSMAVETCSTDLLSRVACSLNQFYDTFHAIGAMFDLFRKLLERLVDVRGRSPTERPLFVAIIDLAKRPGNLNKTVQKLERELTSCEPASALAACSPVSDQMAEALQNAEATFLEEAETLLNSGTSMDPTLFTKVFGGIVKRVELCWHSDHTTMLSLLDMLAKLREFDKPSHDHLAREWLSSVLSAKDRPPLASIVVPMVYNNIVTLQDVLSRGLRIMIAPSVNKEKLVTEMLGLVLYGSVYSEPEHCLTSYRFADSRKDLLRNGLTEVKHLLVAVIEQSAEMQCEGLSTLIADQGFSILVSEVVTQEQGGSSAAADLAKLAASSPTAKGSIMEAIGLSSQPQSTHQCMRELFYAVNDFNIDLCQLALCFVANNKGVGQCDATRDELAQSLVKELSPSFSDRPEAWRQLLRVLPTEVASKAFGMTTSDLLQLLDPTTVSNSTLPQTTSVHDLLVFAQTLPHAPSASTDGDFASLDHLSATITALRNKLSSIHLSTSSEDFAIDAQLRASRIEAVCASVTVLLDLIAAHQPLLTHPKAPATPLTRLALAAAALLMEEDIRVRPDTSRHVFDILAVVTDAMSAEARQHAAQVLAEGPRDPQLEFLFGLSDRDEDHRWDLVSVADGADKTGPGGAHPADKKDSGSAHGADDAPSEAQRTLRLPFTLRRWELVPDAAPLPSENDACLSLTFFGATRSRL